MKKRIVTLISAAMIMMMFLTVSISAAQVMSESATPDEGAATDTERAEYRKNLKSYTVDDISSDDEVIVVLYETEDMDNYTLDTFAAYGAIKIERLQHSKILILTLDRHDKQNVLDVSYALYDISGIHFAHPDFMVFPSSVDADKPEVTTVAETVNTIETTAVATPDTVQASKTNGTSTTAKGGNAVVTGDARTGYALIALLFAVLLGFAVCRLYTARNND